jgi:hypothetical protein
MEERIIPATEEKKLQWKKGKIPATRGDRDE